MPILTLRRERSRNLLVGCPSCGHADAARRSWVDRLLSASGHPRPCAYAVGEEISPLRNDRCGCGDRLHARGAAC